MHAGEACGANSIFEALTDCHADRIGHGFHLFDESRVDVRQPLRQQQHAATIVKRATVARGNDYKACNSGTRQRLKSVQQQHAATIIKRATVARGND